MDSFLQDWNTEVGVEFNMPVYKKSSGLNNELVELLWQNGEVVLHSQNNGKQNNFDLSNSNQFHKTNNQSQSRASENPESSVHDHESVVASWIDCPIDESFEKNFCADLLSEIPSSTPAEANKPSRNSDVGKEKLDASVFAPPLPKFEALGAAAHRQNFGGIAKIGNVHTPVKRQVVNRVERDTVRESSAMTIGSSRCASNQVVNEVDMSWASSGGNVGKNIHREVSRLGESAEMEMLGQAVTSSSGGSGSSLWKTTMQSNDRKRKIRDAEESECRSDATESAAGNKSSQKSGRRIRVAEVHNQSERRRRDRINEKMKALQELIPHSNKSDKASMLDEAIEYMKSLQLQLQLMWMGSGMAPMMLPGMQHYMSRFGMRSSAAMLPAIQNMMRLSSRFPLVDQATTLTPSPNQVPMGHNPMWNPVNYQNPMQNSSFQEQYAKYMGFHSMPNTPQQPNIFNFGSHSVQQNPMLAPQPNCNGSIG